MIRATQWLPSRKRMAPANRFNHHLDSCLVEGVTGWVLHPTGIHSIRVLVDGRLAGTADSGIPRPDVGSAFENHPGAGEAGFSVVFPDGTFPTQSRHTVTVEVTAGDGDVVRLERELWSVRMDNPRIIPPDIPISALPVDVMATLAEIAPATYSLDTPWDQEAVRAAVSDIASIVRSRAIVKPVLRYARFLRTMSLGFRFVSDHFDPINHLVDPSAKDYRAQATSPDEMLCIANHLYVLQTRGVLETLIECGCFKGFSTCCLSQACAWLGVKMHVFDSFEGLPSSASDYYSEGDFRAPIDEVLDNVRTFGQLAAVELHQGFFSQTLPYFTEPVGCIWMDVDLKSSAQDVMALLPRLPVESCVFSHELPSEAFVGGKPQPTVSEVLPPLVDAFTADGREPMGQHLVGLVGSIRSAQDGIPALDHGDISTIVAAAEE